MFGKFPTWSPFDAYYHNIVNPLVALVVLPFPTFQRQQRHCFGEFPLAANPSIVLHVLTDCNLDPQDLAKLEASSLFLLCFIW
uniref:Uncharacterized protein n=1 Tax=Nelumbo nucifera TaxID=4432 RepID=A0A822ZWW9_NELNU|nr:TPA_asm: hypothetical protein HUJ06_017772 [Nelumbo nucifera]